MLASVTQFERLSDLGMPRLRFTASGGDQASRTISRRFLFVPAGKAA